MTSVDHYICYDCVVDDESISEILTASLSQLPFTGFAEENGVVSAFLAAENLDEAKGSWEDMHLEIQKIFERLDLESSCFCVYSENWNQKWEDSFQPVVIEDCCVLRASFHEATNLDIPEIIIDPKMSFGTGHHETTSMMIQQMKRMDLTGKRVFDFGSGTAVLSIFAELRGASHVDALDNDINCLQSAEENIRINQCNNIHPALGNLEAMKGQMYDVILANINRHVLLETMAELGQMLLAGGELILSGVLLTDYSLIAESMEKVGFSIQTVFLEGEWVSVRGKVAVD